MKPRVAAVLFGILAVCAALDVSWIPADPDGPLPLSEKYRTSLSKLCKLDEQGKLKALRPTELRRVRAQCAKLRAAAGWGGGMDFNRGGGSIGALIVMMVCGALLLGRTQRRRAGSVGRDRGTGTSSAAAGTFGIGRSSGHSLGARISTSSTSGSGLGGAGLDRAALREARLAKLGQSNTGARAKAP